MSERKDLTRWNRAGLSRFDYIDGNAVEYLEIVRQQLVKHFADPASGECGWINPPQKVPANELELQDETLVQRQQRLSIRNRRLLETYLQDRRDWAWEISRSVARCCHMLTEHANAYANEGFLGTATQWENVRRLVEMLDYHPAAPASASARISIQAKAGKSGTIRRGFQIRNSPPAGAEKVIFETLQDIHIDAALNELRPLGWNKSQQPISSELPDAGAETLARQLSEVMSKPAIYLDGIGPIQSAKLDTLEPLDGFRIKDFLALDPDNTAVDIDATYLWDWKSRANYLFHFAPAGDWSAIADTSLEDIEASSAEILALQTGNSLNEVVAMKQALEMVQVCLDRPRFQQLLFRQIIVIPESEESYVKTRWSVPGKPEVEAGQAAIIMDKTHDRAQAVTINQIDKIDADPVYLELALLTDPVQDSWSEWSKGDVILHYSSRWLKKCWLNGANVIRTQQAHGLSAESYVGWKVSGHWNYAEVIEADRRDLRLAFKGAMPVPGSNLYQLRPIESNIAGSNLEVVVLLDSTGAASDNTDAVEDVPLTVGAVPDLGHIFKVKDLTSEPSPVTLPSLLPPGALPGIGSFLFPTPFLPIDLVKAAVELMLSLGVMVIPSTGEIVIKGLPVSLLGDIEDFGDAALALHKMMSELKVPDTDTELVEWIADDPVTELETILKNIATADTPMFQQIREEIDQSGPLLALGKNADRIAKVVSADPPFMFDSTADRIQSGNWVAAEFTDGLRALKISQIDKFTEQDKTESFSLSFENLPVVVGELVSVHADFRGELVPHEANINLSPVEPESFHLEQIPEGLIGRQVLVSGCGEPYQTQVSAIDGNRVVFDPPIRPCPAGNMIIHGNVVLAGHGESQPQKIIGSGNAAQSNQEFTLEVAGVSFVADASKNSGVAAAIETEVDGRVWKQVASLKDSIADDHHYQVRMTEEGFVKIIFGDGRNGRRLPTGKNNVRVSYRVGSGMAGNLAAENLDKVIKPSPLIESVSQPIASSGGGDMEDQHSLRENAPPTLLALERAVSLSDFSHLAAAQSNIWHARAFNELLHAGRMQKVIVIVVPAGGVLSPERKTELESYLQKHAMPATQVCVQAYTPKTVNLNITIRVDSAAFIPREIENAVKKELILKLALHSRGLGEPLYLSEIYKIVENTEGVENSICKLNAGATVVPADDRSSVVHLDLEAGSSLDISSEEYRP